MKPFLVTSIDSRDVAKSENALEVMQLFVWEHLDCYEPPSQRNAIIAMPKRAICQLPSLIAKFVNFKDSGNGSGRLGNNPLRAPN